MGFDVADGRPGGLGQGLQGADLVDHVGGEVFGADVDVAAAEARQVAVAHLRADPYAAFGGGPADPQEPGRVAGMKAAGDVGAGDQIEHRVVVTKAPHPEAFAEIGIEVHR